MTLLLIFLSVFFYLLYYFIVPVQRASVVFFIPKEPVNYCRLPVKFPHYGFYYVIYIFFKLSYRPRVYIKKTTTDFIVFASCPRSRFIMPIGCSVTAAA